MILEKNIQRLVPGMPFLLLLLLCSAVVAAVSMLLSGKSAGLQQVISGLQSSTNQITQTMRLRDEYMERFNGIAHSHSSPAAFRFQINNQLNKAVSKYSITGSSAYTLDRRYLLRTDPYASNTTSAAVSFYATETTLDLELVSEAEIFSILQTLVPVKDRMSIIESCLIKESRAHDNEPAVPSYFHLNCALTFYEIAGVQGQSETGWSSNG